MTFFNDAKPLIIAEIAQAHDGSLGTAHAFIDAVASTGADYIKFQTHIAEEESTLFEPWRVKFSYEDETRYDYWQRMEFTTEQWCGLKNHCDEVGIGFVSSPFSGKAVKVLDDIGIPFWKLASGEVDNLPLIDQMIETQKPIVVSTGLVYESELEQLVNYIKEFGIEVALMQCTSMYPTDLNKIGLTQLKKWRDRYGIQVGLSDHSSNINVPIAALALKASMIEVHVTMSKSMFGPDTGASLTMDELAKLVKARDDMMILLSETYDKDNCVKEIDSLRYIFRKSIAANKNLISGHKITADDLKYVKPQKGILACDYKKVLGCSVIRDISKGEFLIADMLEGYNGD